MALLMATVTQDRLLQLPKEAEVQLEPGQKLQVQIDPEVMPSVPPKPNEKALSALQEIARRQQGRRHTDGSQTEELLRSGRTGAMYGDSYAE